MDTLNRREFRLFNFLMLIIDDLNQSFSLVQYERFKRERLYHMATGKELKYKSEIEDKKRSRRRLFDDLRWMLEYNQNGFMSLFIYLIHIIILIALATQALIFSSFQTERDPITGELINKYLRLVEEWLFVDTSHLFDSSSLLNRIVLFILLRFLTLRIRALYIKIKRAKKNRYGYKSINIVDIDFCHVLAYHNHPKNIVRRTFESLTHECCSSKSLSGNDRRFNLEFNKKVRNLDRIDRIYFYNQISFNKCYNKLDLLDKYHRDIKPIEAKLAQELIYNSKRVTDDSDVVFDDTKQPKLSWLQSFFYIELPNRFAYLPSPEYRIDLGVGALMLCLYALLLVSIVVILVISGTVFMLWISNISESVIRIQPFILTQTIKMLLLLLCVTINSCDNIQLGYSSLVAISRSYKIAELLNNEVDFYRFHQRKFVPIYDEHCKNYKLEYKDGDSLESDEYCLLLLAYKRRIPRVQVEEFNENLNYLLDLIEVMLFELDDRKSLFTTYLDINLIFGVVESSTELALILIADSALGIASAYLFALVSCASLFISLFTGATSELAFSSIYCNLSPFLVNEFSLVDPDVHSRMFKICKKLVSTENRSYVILGNFPLTVSSLPTILGWVATITILFQRFI